jgi:hypothetical protein
MNRRRHGTKPTIALWMLVAVADVALLVAAVGPLIVLLCLAGLVTVAGSVLGLRMLSRRTDTNTEAVVRRRA